MLCSTTCRICQEKGSKDQETSAAGSTDDVADTLPMDETGVDSAPVESDQENVQETGEEEHDKEDDAEVELVVDHEQPECYQQDMVSGDDMEDSQPAAARGTKLPHSAKDKTQVPKSVTPAAQPDETPAVVSEEEGPEACKGTHKDCMHDIEICYYHPIRYYG